MHVRKTFKTSRPTTRRPVFSKRPKATVKRRAAAVTTWRAKPTRTALSGPPDMVHTLVSNFLRTTDPQAEKPTQLVPYKNVTELKSDCKEDDDFKPLPSTDELKALLHSSRLLHPGKVWRFHLGTTFTMSTSATGTVNSVMQNSALTSMVDFFPLASLFSEYFVVTMKCVYTPVSMFQIPGMAPVATTQSSQPVGVCMIQGGEGMYSGMNSMINNPTCIVHSTALPWTYTWRNYIRYTNTTPAPIGSTANQSWHSFSDSTNYSGAVQILGNGPYQETTQLIGVMACTWDLAVRVRA